MPTKGPDPDAYAMSTTYADSTELAIAFEHHAARLKARARRIVVDPHLAEEVVQEAFIRAWRAYCRFDPDGGPLVNWLLAITGNVAIDMARARARRPAPAPDVPGSEDGDIAGTVSDVDRLILRDQLNEALAKVSPQHRSAVIELVLLDRPQAEVAAELGINPATLRTRLHYALRQLRVLLREDEAA
jgi:RNA polymerase sigma-70 factor (ECF subfamily)